jgi:endonuclease YncB( thermonuclease family)
MRITRIVFAAALILPAALPVAAQETREAPASSRSIRWTLVPPVIGRPCPSELNGAHTPKALVMGTYKLSKQPPPVIDGDTIRVEGVNEALRMIGLDAEETFRDRDPDKRRRAESDWSAYVAAETAGTDPAHPPKYATFMGEAAKDAMKQLLEGVTEVRLEWDDENRKTDTFGRHLVFVLVQKDGRWINLNVEMVRQGLSPYFVKYGRAQRMNDLFVAAQKEARNHHRGIWADPGPFHHYPDYATRLKWWEERADALEAAECLAKERKNVFILGRADDWNRLKAMEGKKVVVFGSPLPVIEKGEVVLVPFSHQRGKDFMVAGSAAEIAKLALKKEEGNLLFLSGTVELHRGEPQFRATTVTWSRTPAQKTGTESAPAQKTGAESAPASR